MKRSLGILGVILVGGIGVTGAGCGGGPTAPGGGSGGNGIPAGLNLSGTWTGTVTDRVGSCQPETFTVNLVQGDETTKVHVEGSDVSGTFSTPCGGTFVLQGFLTKGHVFGTIAGRGRILGTAAEREIDISIIGGVGGLDGGQVTVAQISMQK